MRTPKLPGKYVVQHCHVQTDAKNRIGSKILICLHCPLTGNPFSQKQHIRELEVNYRTLRKGKQLHIFTRDGCLAPQLGPQSSNSKE